MLRISCAMPPTGRESVPASTVTPASTAAAVSRPCTLDPGTSQLVRARSGSARTVAR